MADQPKTARQGNRAWPPYGELMGALFQAHEEIKYWQDRAATAEQELDTVSGDSDAGTWGGGQRARTAQQR